MKKTLSVSAIEKGCVIDHILPGQAIKIIELLQLNSAGAKLTLGMNLQSRRLGTKDMIKLENHCFSDEECGNIAVFSPTATITCIEDFEPVKKFKVEVPPTIIGLLACLNSQCITQVENITTHFTVTRNGNLTELHCHYCEAIFELHDLLGAMQ